MDEAQQNMTPEDYKVMLPRPSSSTSVAISGRGHSRANNEGNSFDCAICYESLMKPGPPLDNFSFGRLLINVRHLSATERKHICREFQLEEERFVNGFYCEFDCDKILSTICGHVFHKGCLREWFFVQRTERNPKCPFCNMQTFYEECHVLHPLSCMKLNDDTNNEQEVHQVEEEEEEEPREFSIPCFSFNETEYSDISGTSSSWPSDNEGNDSATEMEEEEEGSCSEDDRIEEIRVIEVGQEDRFRLTPPVHAEPAPDSQGRLGFIYEYNLTHIITLMNVVKGETKLCLLRKELFLEEIEKTADTVEDEYLSEIEPESLVPLGYSFGLLIFYVWLSIFAVEVIMDGLKKWREEETGITKPSKKDLFLIFVIITSCFLLTNICLLTSDGFNPLILSACLAVCLVSLCPQPSPQDNWIYDYDITV